MALNLEASDMTWDREQQLRQALALARSMILSGESMTDSTAKRIDDALSGRQPQ